MITGTVINGEAVAARLGKMSVAVLAQVKMAVYDSTIKLSRKVREEKLNGQVLKRRTSNLVNSIARGTGVVHLEGSSIGTVGLGADAQSSKEGGMSVAKYGRIWEETGVRAHVVTAKNGKALRWKDATTGKFRFAKSVSIPAQAPRPFLKPSLVEIYPAYIQALNEAVVKGTISE